MYKQKMFPHIGLPVLFLKLNVSLSSFMNQEGTGSQSVFSRSPDIFILSFFILLSSDNHSFPSDFVTLRESVFQALSPP